MIGIEVDAVDWCDMWGGINVGETIPITYVPTSSVSIDSTIR